MLNMEKKDFRSLIKHYFLRGKTAKDTKEKLDKYYGANAPLDYTVKYWFREFRGGRNSTADEDRSGRPSEAVTLDNVKKIHVMVLADRKVKVRELADATEISTERTRHILGEILHMKKLSCRWVPRMLTPEQKVCLAMLMRIRADFWRRLVTVDETWIHYYTPENRMSARQWTKAGTSAPKRPREAQWVGKVMASVFWDCHGILFVDYLIKGKTINSEYYCALLERLKAEIAAKRLHMKRKKFCFCKTMRRHTIASQPWLKPTIYGSNSFPIHLIFPIWLPRTIISSQTSKDGSSIKNSARARRSSTLRRSILQIFRKITFRTGSKIWKIVGISVSI